MCAQAWLSQSTGRPEDSEMLVYPLRIEILKLKNLEIPRLSLEPSNQNVWSQAAFAGATS